LPLGLVESPEAKNVVFAPSFMKFKANSTLSILTIVVEEREDVVSMGHACKDRVSPGIGSDSSETTGGAIKNHPIVYAPKVLHDHRSKNSIKYEDRWGVVTFIVVGA